MLVSDEGFEPSTPRPKRAMLPGYTNQSLFFSVLHYAYPIVDSALATPAEFGCWTHVQESNLCLNVRSVLSFPLNERELNFVWLTAQASNLYSEIQSLVFYQLDDP